MEHGPAHTLISDFLISRAVRESFSIVCGIFFFLKFLWQPQEEYRHYQTQMKIITLEPMKVNRLTLSLRFSAETTVLAGVWTELALEQEEEGQGFHSYPAREIGELGRGLRSTGSQRVDMT